MGSWLYAYMLPDIDSGLNAAPALRALASRGFSLDTRAVEVSADGEGHCEPRGREHDLTKNGLTTALELLDSGVDLHLTAQNRELFISCTFARCAGTPHVILAWSERLFNGMIGAQQEEFVQSLLLFSKQLGAGAVVLLLDAPGYFEDRIALSRHGILVDASLPSGRQATIKEVWTKGEASVDGASVLLSGKLNGFNRFMVVQ